MKPRKAKPCPFRQVNKNVFILEGDITFNLLALAAGKFHFPTIEIVFQGASGPLTPPRPPPRDNYKARPPYRIGDINLLPQMIFRLSK